ncbi:MAG: hypothetical protein ABSG71_16150 [Thermodesulfobacteriota bacterium]|jgi:hypothetical protein
MDALRKILNTVFTVLFVEAVLLTPAVIIVATLGDFTRTLKYLVPFLVALMPRIILKITKNKIRTNKDNIIPVILVLVVSIGFLLFFSFLTLATCAGHPPY